MKIYFCDYCKEITAHDEGQCLNCDKVNDYGCDNCGIQFTDPSREPVETTDSRYICFGCYEDTLADE